MACRRGFCLSRVGWKAPPIPTATWCLGEGERRGAGNTGTPAAQASQSQGHMDHVTSAPSLNAQFHQPLCCRSSAVVCPLASHLRYLVLFLPHILARRPDLKARVPGPGNDRFITRQAVCVLQGLRAGGGGPRRPPTSTAPPTLQWTGVVRVENLVDG